METMNEIAFEIGLSQTRLIYARSEGITLLVSFLEFDLQLLNAPTILRYTGWKSCSCCCYLTVATIYRQELQLS